MRESAREQLRRVDQKLVQVNAVLDGKAPVSRSDAPQSRMDSTSEEQMTKPILAANPLAVGDAAARARIDAARQRRAQKLETVPFNKAKAAKHVALSAPAVAPPPAPVPTSSYADAASIRLAAKSRIDALRARRAERSEQMPPFKREAAVEAFQKTVTKK